MSRFKKVGERFESTDICIKLKEYGKTLERNFHFEEIDCIEQF